MLVRLRELRKEAGISQQRLANELGISQQSINKYENHNVQPDLSVLIQIADYFQTSVDYLISCTDNPARPPSRASFPLSREESALLENYRRLSSDEQKSISLVIHNYLKAKER
ncbi:MAG: helix-turn-helix transcriptional regulator [Clostridia bacterium]|nr:helix-turn-helix transcriptional regulator [Clostridia bacterium]